MPPWIPTPSLLKLHAQNERYLIIQQSVQHTQACKKSENQTDLVHFWTRFLTGESSLARSRPADTISSSTPIMCLNKHHTKAEAPGILHMPPVTLSVS